MQPCLSELLKIYTLIFRNLPFLKNSRLHAWNLAHLFVYLFIFNLFVVDKFYFSLQLD